MAKKRKAKKNKIKRKQPAKKTRKKGGKKKAAAAPVRTPNEILFEGCNGRPPASDEELNEWLASQPPLDETKQS